MITIRFYEELNDFLAPSRRKRDVEVVLTAQTSVKHFVESLGVPHTEVDLILVNGRSVDFSHRIQDGDRISVYPVFESLDVHDAQRLRPRPLRRTRFVVDANLGRLARHLRLLGFDVQFDPTLDDARLVAISVTDRRILLTRDRGLLMHREVTHGLYVHAVRPPEQLREVVRRLHLEGSIRLLRRCLRCNGNVRAVERSTVESELEPLTRHLHERFWKCRDCGRIYWRGSHVRRMVQRLRDIRE